MKPISLKRKGEDVLENNKMKKQMSLLYAVFAIVIFAVLITTVVLLVSGDHAEDGTTTEKTTTMHTTEATPTETTTETTVITTETTTATTTEQTTYPPATLPTWKEEEPQGLDEQTKTYLMALDNTNIAWGMGPYYDEKNRPLDAVKSQEKYGKYGSLYVMDDDNIYLTFDEGYENGYTAKILDILKEKNVKAVFFITLPYAKKNTDLVQRMIDEGHIVGNHSASHPSFPTLSVDEAYADIKELHDYVYNRFGYTMTLFRFPEGASSDRMQALLQEMGYTSVFWSFAYRDWETENQPSHSEAFQQITSRLHPGAIYLLHAVSQTNTELLPYIIDDFRSKGYEFALYSAA